MTTTTRKQFPIPTHSLDGDEFDEVRLARALKVSADKAMSIKYSLIDMFPGRDVLDLTREEWAALWEARRLAREAVRQTTDLYGIDEDAYYAQHPDGLDLTNE